MFGDVFRGRRVFVTGHTGFKGSWLTLWLLELGAECAGYALDPPTTPSLFEERRTSRRLAGARFVDRRGDVRDGERAREARWTRRIRRSSSTWPRSRWCGAHTQSRV